MKPRAILGLFVLIAVSTVLLVAQARHNSSAVPRTATTSSAVVPDFTGVWLVDEAPISPDRIISTTLDVTGPKFKLHGYWGLKADWTGSFQLNDDGTPGNFKLNSDGISFKERGLAGEFPPCRLLGIYKLDVDRLTICFAKAEVDRRPSLFRSNEHADLASFVRAPPGWSGLPKTIKITVLDPQGRADPSATIFGFASRIPPYKKPGPDGKFYIDTTQPAVVSYSASMSRDLGEEKIGADGSIVVPYGRFEQQIMPMGARDAARGLIGLAPISPAILSHGTLTIPLRAQRVVRGMISVDGERPAEEQPPWRGAYLTAFHERVAWCSAPDGAFEFCVPPGDYSLYAYGNDLIGQTREMTVPDSNGALVLPSMLLGSSKLLSLLGKTAPALTGVEAWKNGRVVLRDLKGKLVLLDFWGYWCGNCVHDMPNLFRLHDKYKDRGLVIIGVHVDKDGEVDTVDKLDARTKMYREGLWKGRDLPFPVAICSGKFRNTTGNSATYGISYYPTAIFIDRHGNLLGNPLQQLKFDLNDTQAADAAIEKLLAEP